MLKADHSITTTSTVSAADQLATPIVGCAELVEIGREAGPKIDQVRARTALWFATPNDQVDQIDTLIHHDRLWELFDRAITLKAATLDAVRAKLMLARWQLEVEHWRDGAMDIESMSPSQRMTWSLCDDLLGSTSAASESATPMSEVHTPDADLLAACAEFDRLEYGFLRLYHGPNKHLTDEQRRG